MATHIKERSGGEIRRSTTSSIIMKLPPAPLGSSIQVDNDFSGAMLSLEESATMAKKEIGEIRLDPVGERQRLSLDCGAKRPEIGEFLGEPERERLFEVLRSWKG